MDELYTVLGVAETASRDEIKEAYRRLAFQYHPDRNKDPGAEERFKQIGEAYAVLSDSEERALYGALGPERYGDPDENFRYWMERQRAMSEERSGQVYYVSMRPNHEDIIDLITTLFVFLIFCLLLKSL